MAEAGDRAREQHVIIPGVEHKFFEEELDKMEQHSSGVDSVVVLAVDNSPHSEFAFNCEYSPAGGRSDCCLLIVGILCQSAARLYCLFACGSAGCRFTEVAAAFQSFVFVLCWRHMLAVPVRAAFECVCVCLSE